MCVDFFNKAVRNSRRVRGHFFHLATVPNAQIPILSLSFSPAEIFLPPINKTFVVHWNNVLLMLISELLYTPGSFQYHNSGRCVFASTTTAHCNDLTAKYTMADCKRGG